jgi:hypothetical protein
MSMPISIPATSYPQANILETSTKASTMLRLLKKSRSISIITTQTIKPAEEVEEVVAVEVELEAEGHLLQSMSIRKDSISRIRRS